MQYRIESEHRRTQQSKTKHIYKEAKKKRQNIWKTSHDSFLPAYVAAIIRFDTQRALPRELAQTIPAQLVAFVRRRGEAHSADMVRPRVRGDGVRARLPDARREVEPRARIRCAVPVQDELGGANELAS